MTRTAALAYALVFTITFTTLFFPKHVKADEFSGTTISILDGDTIDVLYKKQPQRIHLHGIDCPEKGQPYGTKTKQATAALVFRKEVTVHLQGQDKYGRSIGKVLLSDGRMLNHELVKEGWCWWFRKYAPNDTELEALETEAHEARRGLWNDPAPIPPWIYRKARQKKMDLLDVVPLKDAPARWDRLSELPYRYRCKKLLGRSLLAI